MRHALAALVLVLVSTGCPAYDRERLISDQKGLVPPDVFARYGTEQAQSVAIGRALAASLAASPADDRDRTMVLVAGYAQSMPNVVTVVPDARGPILTVTFRSGWQKAITPINDGVSADQTPGVPSAR